MKYRDIAVLGALCGALFGTLLFVAEIVVENLNP